MRYPREGRIHLLKDIVGEVEGLKILDYGGNHGNLLKDGIKTGEINPADYTCLDVNKEIVEGGKEEHPDANWFYYDRYNPVYNPSAKKRLPFPFEDKTFDVVFSYSIHTHCSYEDFIFDLSEMKRVSKTVVTSIMNDGVLNFLKLKRQMDYGDKVHPAWENPYPLEQYRYYVDGEFVVYTESDIPHSCDFLISLYNYDWLKSQHPEIEITEPFTPYNQPFVVWKE